MARDLIPLNVVGSDILVDGADNAEVPLMVCSGGCAGDGERHTEFEDRTRASTKARQLESGKEMSKILTLTAVESANAGMETKSLNEIRVRAR